MIYKSKGKLDKAHGMKCPFCGDYAIDNYPVETICSECSTKFEIDDRSECIFVNMDNLKLPIKGTICNVCDLVQVEAREACMYCGEMLCSTRQ
jgi:uncharacterized OB-fold protein